MKRTGQARHRRLRGALLGVLLLLAAAMPCAAVADGGTGRPVAEARAGQQPVASSGAASSRAASSRSQPSPEPTDTRTEVSGPLPADPALTPPDQPVPQGGTFSVTGQDFDCSEGAGLAGPLTLTVQGQTPVSLTIGDDGRFEHQVTVATDAAPGRYEIRAVCTAVADAPTATTTFDVTAAARPDPRISVSPAAGQPEVRVTVQGTGFVCNAGAGVDVLWDGQALTSGAPSEDGAVTLTFQVPAAAAEGTHQVTASCQAPKEVSASGAFDVKPRTVPRPPPEPREVTIHLTGYPTVCTRGAIVIGGRRLDTWLDADSTEGGAGPGRWELIDLHARVPQDMTGRRDVELACAGRDREKAGEITLPPALPLTSFALPLGSTRHPEGEKGPITPPPVHGGTQEPGGGSQSPTGGTTGGGQGPRDEDDGSGAAKDDKGDEDDKDDGASADKDRGAREPTRDDPALGLVAALRTPADVSWALKDLAGSVGMAVWFLLVVLLLERAFPSQLADNALSRWWLRRRARRQARPARLPGAVRACVFALLGGSLAVWADARTDWSPATAVKAVGAAAGILVILVAYEKTKDSLLRPRRGSVRSELRVVPAGLLLAGLMTAMSRFLEFPVPYVYGLIAVYWVLGSPRRGSGGPDDGLPKGQAVLFGGICVLAASVLVWVLGAPLVEAAQERNDPPGSLRYVIAYAVGLTVVAGIEVVVFGLLPLSGMDGHALKQWNKPAWYALYLTGLTFFFHILLHSLHPGVTNGLAVDGDLRWWTLGMATALFLAFGAASLALRWYVASGERRPQTA
ncbi:FGLLP motif-containing membrane protein [Streptomyces sp. G45]|uniref:FGLLP motif-containing membrane protein n=1 Tax=Streptomyces sp. G45 TaxID=3406627 RepID=UPI003C1497C5